MRGVLSFVERVLSFVIALGVLAWPNAAQAAQLEWKAPEGCVAPQVIIEQVEKLVGQRLSTIAGIDFAIEISAVANEPSAPGRASSYALVLRTSLSGGEPREREIVGASCDEVTDAATVAMALTLSERDRTQPPPSQVAMLPELEGEPSSSIDDDEAPQVEPARMRSAVSVGLFFEKGALPEIGFGVEIGAALEYAALRGGLSFATFASQEARLPGDDSGGAFSLMFGALSVCAHPTINAWHLLGCAGFELGSLSAEGKGIEHGRSGSALWTAPRAEIGVGYALAPTLRFWLRGGGAFALARPEFLIEDLGEVHQPDNLSARGLIAFELVL